jgi:hypothetical protein
MKGTSFTAVKSEKKLCSDDVSVKHGICTITTHIQCPKPDENDALSAK